MKKIIWFTMLSLDGFVTNRDNDIFFHEPSEDVHLYINQLNATNGAMLLDKTGYNIMKYWDDVPAEDLKHEIIKTYTEQWLQMTKIVVGDITLPEHLDNYILWDRVTADRIDQLLETIDGDLVVGSSPLAWELLRLEKLTDIQLITVPILLGAGQSNFSDAGEIQLKLEQHQIFENGWTYLSYKVSS